MIHEWRSWAVLPVLSLAGLLVASPAMVRFWNGNLPKALTASTAAGLQIGGALIGGSVVGAALLIAERRLAASQASRDREAAEAQARETLRLTLSLAPSLDGIDLRGKELAGFYLRAKALARANLDRADLQRANVIDGDLSGARLHHTNLDGALLFRCNLAQVMWSDQTIWPNGAFRAWALEHSQPRFGVEGSYVLAADETRLLPPLGIACSEDDPRYDPTVTATEMPESSSRQLGYL